MNRKIRKLSLAFLFAVILSCGAFAAQDDAGVVGLDSGPIDGKVEDGIREYLGIPYAASPTGRFRWKVPRDVGVWTKVRRCTEFGPSCPQPVRGNIAKISEDCLYLNVWTPAKRPDEKLPVMVWIHGGAWNFGSGSLEEYNGRNLAKKGVVAVTFNYRLGPFGFWAHPRLAMESPHNVSGNYGLLDQIAALWWVQWNIDAFGGDPQNVTIFGESAGSASVTLLMISPLAGGLFHRAIAESGGPMIGMPYLIPRADGDMKAALKMGKDLAAKLKCNKDRDIIGAMRQKSTAEVLDAADYETKLFTEGLFFGPVFDGWALPEDPVAAYLSGAMQDVPLIIGSNKDEGTLFLTESDITLKKYRLFFNDRFAKDAPEAMEIFPAPRQKDVAGALDKAITVSAFAEPARFVADAMKLKRSKAYLYQFTRVPNTEDARILGAYHGIEIEYVFGNLDEGVGYNDDDLELSRAMMDCWVNFARTGSPNGPSTPDWPPYDRRAGRNLEFGDTIKVKERLMEKDCNFIERLRTEKRPAAHEAPKK